MRGTFNIVTRIRGTVGTPKSMCRKLEKLGMKRIGDTAILANSTDNNNKLYKTKHLVRIDVLKPAIKKSRIPPWVETCKFIDKDSKETDIRLRDTTVVDKFKAEIYTH